MIKLLHWLIICYLITIPFGPILSISVIQPNIRLHFSDIIVGLIWFSYLIGYLIHRNYIKTKNNINKPLGIFILILVLSLIKDIFIYPISENLVAMMYLARFVSYSSILLVIKQISYTSKYRTNINQAIFISFVILIIIGFIQMLAFPDLRPLYYLGWDDHYYRLTGLILDPGFNGILLLIGLIYFIQFKRKNNKLPTYSLLLVITYVAILLTYSRATYLSGLIVFYLYTFLNKKIKLTIIGTMIFIISWAYLPRPVGEGGNLNRTSTINFRITNWAQALQVIHDHPLLGVGFNRYSYIQKKYKFLNLKESITSHSASGVDNSYLFIIATTGIVGFLSFLWIWVTMLKNSYSKPTFYILIAVSTHALFHNTIFYSPVLGIVLIAISSNDVKSPI